MFKSMFKFLYNKCEEKLKIAMQSIETEIVEITIKDTKELLTKIKKNSVYEDNGSVSKNNLINAIELLQEILNRANILNGSVSSMSNFPKCLNNGALVEHFDFTKCVTNSIVENQLVSSLAKDPNTKKIINRISNLQCLFTWNIKPNGKKNKIVWIWNKYGEYNLNISSTEFTLERYVQILKKLNVITTKIEMKPFLID